MRKSIWISWGWPERVRDALTARVGSSARTAELARRASAKEGASYRIAREGQHRRQEPEAGLLGEGRIPSLATPTARAAGARDAKAYFRK